MNPCLLPGPQFLVFFVLLSGVVAVACWWAVRVVSGAGLADGAPVPMLDDPYEIALLRDGPGEALRVGLLTLASRGAVHAAHGSLALDGTAVRMEEAHPFERALAQEIGGGATVPSLEKSAPIASRLGQMTERLTEMGLLLNTEQRIVSMAVIGAGGTVLLVTAAVKISVALSTGHTNVLFLVILAVAAVGLLFLGLFRRRTRLGDAALGELREEWSPSGLRGEWRASRNAGGSAPSDVAMGCAILGLGFAPSVLQPFVTSLRTPPSSGGAACGAGGSGCGSDGGDGGGGGCGGCGGCGGD